MACYTAVLDMFRQSSVVLTGHLLGVPVVHLCPVLGWRCRVSSLTTMVFSRALDKVALAVSMPWRSHRAVRDHMIAFVVTDLLTGGQAARSPSGILETSGEGGLLRLFHGAAGTHHCYFSASLDPKTARVRALPN